jgi:hypothetical protein
MVDHEYQFSLERLGGNRGDTTAFFAFANTVARDRTQRSFFGYSKAKV